MARGATEQLHQMNTADNDSTEAEVDVYVTHSLLEEAVGAKGGGSVQAAESVDLHSRGLTNCTGVELCKHVALLDLSFNKLTGVSGVGSGTQQRTLTELRLFNNRLCGNVGQSLKFASSLRILELQNNENIDSDSLRGLEQLKHLESLRVDGCCISDCRTLGRIASLRELDVSRNRLRTLDGLARLQNLQDLNVSWNMLTSLNGINKCQALLEVKASSNSLESALDVKNLEKIDVLRLDNNCIASLDALPSSLPNLTELHLKHNKKLTQLPDLADKFPALELVDVNCCPLDSVLHAVKNLQWLAELNCLDTVGFSNWNVDSAMELIAHSLPQVVYVDDRLVEGQVDDTKKTSDGVAQEPSGPQIRHQADSDQLPSCSFDTPQTTDRNPLDAVFEEETAPALHQIASYDSCEQPRNNSESDMCNQDASTFSEEADAASFQERLDAYHSEMETAFARLRQIISQGLNSAAHMVRNEDGVMRFPRPPTMATVDSINPTRRAQAIMQREAERHKKRRQRSDEDESETQHRGAEVFHDIAPIEAQQRIQKQTQQSENVRDAFSKASIKLEEVQQSSESSEVDSARNSRGSSASTRRTSKPSRPLSRANTAAPTVNEAKHENAERSHETQQALAAVEAAITSTGDAASDRFSTGAASTVSSSASSSMHSTPRKDAAAENLQPKQQAHAPMTAAEYKRMRPSGPNATLRAKSANKAATRYK